MRLYWRHLYFFFIHRSFYGSKKHSIIKAAPIPVANESDGELEDSNWNSELTFNETGVELLEEILDETESKTVEGEAGQSNREI